VIYGFGDFQGWRDTMSRAWMHSSGDDWPFLPLHVALNGETLIEHPSLERFPRVPFEARSALAHLAESAYLDRYAYTPDNEPLIRRTQRAGGIVHRFATTNCADA
jgi:hypothetical protein